MTLAPHRLVIRVYYEDTDFSGLVYHASYLRFFERGRTEFLRALGIDQSVLFNGDVPIAFAVVRLSIEFRRPARMDDLVTVETRCRSVGGASLVMAQRLLRGEALLTEAEVRVAALAGGRAARLPAALAAKLAAAAESAPALAKP